ncbi:hypothetical protein JQ615_27155 [Bradyrhizobium jicamae]|uniref:Uncharacterized protein n=1 Tax=Bradyrhizobium jicamae TaxID=280332 RepID=A0ABS5FQJ3_9BRAD|nr:hypothetical protein [Bradyrhizobium jicamae]MBR0799071.1 hypothetical protein [Bradyrhizobium jicamae]MBR0936875.1 hypothetical protein [Bradyrhizobium jicamae]
MRLPCALVLLLLPSSGLLAKEQGGLTIEWDGGTINFPKARISLPERDDQASPPAKRPTVDCSMIDMRVACWKLRAEKKSKDGPEPYGTNLRFVQPIAIIPVPDRQQAWTDAQREKFNDWSERARNPKYVARLPAFKMDELTQAELEDAPNQNPLLGPDSEAHLYAAASSALGGPYALSLWQSLLNRRPTRECLQTGQYCSVVVKGSIDDREAMAYCAIQNSSIGAGIPFNCEIVAYKYRDRDPWYVLSYDGPRQCDGCGAAAGASCTLDTKLPLEKIVASFVAAMKDGRTNLQLNELKKTASKITLVGRNEATVSKFYAGYYDKSYASYVVESNDDDGRRYVTIEGLFNLLISVAPSSQGKDYREFGRGKGDADLEWFQGQVLDIVRKDLAAQLGTKVECDVQPIE